MNLGENRKRMRPKKEKNERRNSGKQVRRGQRMRSQGTFTHRILTPPPPPQEAKVALEPVKMV